MEGSTVSESEKDFQAAIESIGAVEEGQLVDGTIIQVDSEYVFLDIGHKSEGQVPLTDFREAPSVGDVVTVQVVKPEDRYGRVVVSRKRVEAKAVWQAVKDAFDSHSSVQGRVVKVIKGGFEVDLGLESTAFTPISKMDLHRIENPEEYVGLVTDFYIERLYSETTKKLNIVLSRRELLKERLNAAKKEFFEKTSVGDEVEGVVKSFTSFGAFVDLGGFDGLLHINDMSWGHTSRAKDFVKKGDKIKLKVIRLNEEEGRINLSLKHFAENPWTTFEDRYQVRDVIKGKVTKIADFGVFIEIEEGIEGLAHISEFSWIKRIDHPKEVFKPGDEVEVMILGYDIHEGRVSLGIKQVLPNPWDDMEKKYPVGTRLTRKIQKVTNAGAFIELEEGLDGFLHGDDISWTKRGKNSSSVLKEGEEIDVVIINVDTENCRIRLGVKQLTENPWQALADLYDKSQPVEGTVSDITDFGLFVMVRDGIEGLIHKSNLSNDRGANADELLATYQVGDKISAAIVEILPDRQKLSLSIRALTANEQKREISKYIQGNNEEGDATFTLGDALESRD